jgi:hypothetical protein
MLSIPERPLKSMKHKFTAEEDRMILEKVAEYGAGRWNQLATFFENRSGRQIRERYMNYLSPTVNHDEWTEEENQKLISLVEAHGTNWKSIRKHFPGRTDVALKNHYVVIKRNPNGRTPIQIVEPAQAGDGETGCDFGFGNNSHTFSMDFEDFYSPFWMGPPDSNDDESTFSINDSNWAQ